MAPYNASQEVQGSHLPPELLDSKSGACAQKLLNASHMRSPPRADQRGHFLCSDTDIPKS